jgi:hypothetical protein
MADAMIFAIAIASAVSLLIVSPHEAQRKALRALRAYGETEALPPAVVAKTSQDRYKIFSHWIWWNESP